MCHERSLFFFFLFCSVWASLVRSAATAPPSDSPVTPNPTREVQWQSKLLVWKMRRMGAYLWGDIIRGPTEGSGRDPLHHVLLAHPEVSDLDVPFGVQHDVV